MRRQRAFRITAWLAALAVIVLPLVAAVNGWLAADRWPFRQLSVNGSFRHVSVEQVRHAAMPALNPGYFAVDLDLVRASVSALPWIEHAEVRKHWPDQIEIAITEREAIARWGSDKLLSLRGDLYSVPASTFPDGLPQFNGSEELRHQIQDFYRQALVTLAPIGLTPSGVVLSGRGAWTLALSNGGELLLGREQANQRLVRFAEVYRQLSATDATRLQRADLRYENGFALRWSPPAEPDAVPLLVEPRSDIPLAPPTPMAPGAITNEPAHI